MVFLEFEEPIEKLYEQLEKIMDVADQGEIDVQDKINEIETKIRNKRKEIYAGLNGWQKVQLSRHPERPYTLYYINQICKSFTELHGDRYFGDDKAIVGGLGKIDGQSVVILGHQKGVNTKMRQYRNFGMANPEGYRKSLRLMKLAEKFDMPVICLIDTPGAFPGIEAEERGQAEAIAKNLIEMAQLKVPIICYIIGEGASGGAIGIGLGDRVYMLEFTWYSVISPESCSSILWRNWDHKAEAAEQLKLTSEDMLEFGLIDGVIQEPTGGAHSDPEKMAKLLKKQIKKDIAELSEISPKKRIENRLKKYNGMGRFKTK
jgi:acetyl-CoA carboxylase carboxyl transferase subunit alpha